MIWLPFRAIFIIGLVIVLGHNSLDFFEKNNPNSGWLYDLIHRPGQFPLWGNHGLFIFYPFFPGQD